MGNSKQSSKGVRSNIKDDIANASKSHGVDDKAGIDDSISNRSSSSRGAANSVGNTPFEDSNEIIERLNSEIAELNLEVSNLRYAAGEASEEQAGLNNQIAKLLADYQNIERGIDNRVELKLLQMKKSVAAGMIEVADDLRYAIEASKMLELDDKTKAWLQGIVDTVAKMEDVFAELGAVSMKIEVGDAYDSSMHEAIAVVDNVEKPDDENTIYEVVQTGYLIDETVIRPAKVVVNKKKV